jgi:ATP-dependent DNA helicase 2 subunit 1
MESKAIFHLLLSSLLNTNQMVVCSFVRRVNAIPKIVALLPQVRTKKKSHFLILFFLKAEKLDNEGNQIDPPGFQMIISPYVDEIRPVPPYLVPASKYKQNGNILY